MKATILALATLLVAAVSAPVSGFAQAADKLNIGDDLPGKTISMKNATGKDMTLGQAVSHGGLLVMFSCNTCPYVIKNQAATKQAMEYANKRQITVVVINSNEAKRDGDDSYAAMKKYAADNGYNTPYLVDQNSKLADLFGANHTPEIFLFDGNAKLVYKGAMNDNPADPAAVKEVYIEKAIDAMMAGKPANPGSTKSIGCSIKRKA